jgi:hypothetical protein
VKEEEDDHGSVCCVMWGGGLMRGALGKGGRAMDGGVWHTACETEKGLAWECVLPDQIPSFLGLPASLLLYVYVLSCLRRALNLPGHSQFT